MNEVIVVNFTCINHGWPDNDHDTMLGVSYLRGGYFPYANQGAPHRLRTETVAGPPRSEGLADSVCRAYSLFEVSAVDGF